MTSVTAAGGLYSMLAATVLILHLLFILWVLFGALVARSRPWLRRLHIACLVWGVLIAVVPWPCPLTPLENWLESRAGVEPYHGGFLLHYLDALVYPNIPPVLLTVISIAVCALNLGLYVWRPWSRHKGSK